jgi:hypothetical protein|tara:strand:- start:483 stop:620 length:138 start_codon:yes stop_codon:yes gene_type:complete
MSKDIGEQIKSEPGSEKKVNEEEEPTLEDIEAAKVAAAKLFGVLK